MKVLCNIFLSAIINVEDAAEGLIAVAVQEPATFSTTALVINGPQDNDDKETSLYAIHATLEHRLKIVSQEIDQFHAKRVELAKEAKDIQ